MLIWNKTETFFFKFLKEILALMICFGRNYIFMKTFFIPSGGRLLVYIKGEFSWTNKVNSRGHFW